MMIAGGNVRAHAYFDQYLHEPATSCAVPDERENYASRDIVRLAELSIHISIGTSLKNAARRLQHYAATQCPC